MNKSSLLREPLLHFLLLGILIFGADRYLHPQTDDRRTITISNAVESELITLFKNGRGREPTNQELNQLSYRWLQNEVYYREALALGLDQGDEMFRSRLVLKMREVLRNNLVVPSPTTEELRGWFEANRAKYEAPARYDVSQFLVADLQSGSEKQASELLQTIRDEVPEPYTDTIRVYSNLSSDNVTKVFGPGFAAALLAKPDMTWRVLQSKQGWHIARIDAVHPAVPAVFEDVQDAVKGDWEAAQQRLKAVDAIRSMRQHYKIVTSGAKRIDAALSIADGEKASEGLNIPALVEPPRTWAEE